MSTFNPITKIWRGRGQPLTFKETDNLGKTILNKLSEVPDKIVQISDNNGVTLTGSELRVRCIRVAQNLGKMGFKQGDVIAVIGKNNHNIAPVVTGCFLIGAPVNTLDPTFDKKDISHMLQLTQPKAVICESYKVAHVQEALEENNLEIPIIVFADDDIQDTISVQKLLLETGSEDTFHPVDLGPASEVIGCIICSSGTTGLSKGVILSHAQLLTKIQLFWKGELDDVTFAFSSLYWLSGMGVLLSGLFSGGTRIITTDVATAKLLAKLIIKYNITKLFVPPSMVGQLLNDSSIETKKFPSLKQVLCGGSTVSDHLRESMNKYLENGIVVIAYGMTEAGGPFCRNEISKPKSVGSLCAGVEVKVVDVDDTDNHYGINEDGEICFRQSPRFLGYYGNEAATAEIRDGEWLRSGDIGHFDDEGFLFIVDRKKDIMKYCGFQISPSEIESFVSRIDGVVMVSVVGIPDEVVSDLPAAVVVRTKNSHLTVEDIIQAVEQEMVDYKRLRGGVYFVDEIPLTPSGKVIKARVKQIAIGLYNESKWKNYDNNKGN